MNHPIYAGPISPTRDSALQAQRALQIAKVTDSVKEALARELAPIKKQLEENGREIAKLQTRQFEQIKKALWPEISQGMHRVKQRVLEQYRGQGLLRS